jgi:hypothetical protein
MQPLIKKMVPLDQNQNEALQMLAKVRIAELRMIEENPVLIRLYESILDQLERFI